MVTYTDPTQVSDVRTTDPLAARTATGYGRKLPTWHMIRYADRWHRVYAMCYGNAASIYIIHGGEELVLDIDTEYRLLERQA